MKNSFERADDNKKERKPNIKVEHVDFDKIVIRVGNITLTFFRKDRIGNRLGKPLHSKDDASNLGSGALEVSGIDKKDAYAFATKIFEEQDAALLEQVDKDKKLRGTEEALWERGGDPED